MDEAPERLINQGFLVLLTCSWQQNGNIIHYFPSK